MKQPLAFRIRPQNIDEIVGQQHLLNSEGIIQKCIKDQQLFSMIFFGPPGTGKTTLAMVLAQQLKRPYRLFNAVTGNKKELDQILLEAKMSSGFILIMDEVHRLNRDKQDHLLPFIEEGIITLIGATTANPYYAINASIRSRVHLLEFYRLTHQECLDALTRALRHPDGFKEEIQASQKVLSLIVRACNGDIRYALNLLEICALATTDAIITEGIVNQYCRIIASDSEDQGDGYYDLLSGFQKSIRGSDVDASLYYLARLIHIGDIDSIERRLLVTAYEDIGLANPALVARTIAAIDTAKRVGFPEAAIPLGIAVIDLAVSPKSKTGCEAISAALATVKETTAQIPKYLRLTPVGLDEELKYPYDHPELWAKLAYLPEELTDRQFYFPKESSAYERVIFNNLLEIKKIKRVYSVKQAKKREP